VGTVVTRQVTRDPHGRDADLRQLARGSTLNLAGSLVAASLTLVLPVIVTRSFPEHEAGLFFQATALFLIMLNVGTVGADTGVLRSLPRATALGRAADLRRYLLVALVPAALVAVVLAAALAVASGSISTLVTTDADEAAAFADVLLVLLPWLPVAVIYTILVAASRGLGSVRPLVVVEKIGRHLLETGGAAAAVMVSTSLALIATAWVAPYAAMLVVISAWVVRRLRRVAPGLPNRDLPRAVWPLAVEFWRFSLPGAASRVFTVLLQRFDILVVGALRGPADAAVYAAATRFVVLGLMFVQAIQQVMAPKIAECLALEDPRRAETIYRTTTTWLTLVAWPIYLMAAWYASLLMGVFGPSYHRGALAAGILCLAMLVATVCGPVDSVLLMSGRSGHSLVNTGAGLVTTVGLDLLLVPALGPTGAALGWAAGILVKNLMGLWQVRRMVGMHPLGAGTRTAVAISLTSFGVVAGALRLLLGATAWSFLVAGVVASGVHLWLAHRRSGVLDLAALWAVARRR
jgi:O-antigen/teichoic acid export membrane protein